MITAPQCPQASNEGACHVAGVTAAIMTELRTHVAPPPREWLSEAECDAELGYKPRHDRMQRSPRRRP
jgi:hypothetical protein